MATLVATHPDLFNTDAGLVSADSDGDMFLANRRTVLIIGNRHANAKTITISSYVTDTPGQTADDLIINAEPDTTHLVRFKSYVNRFVNDVGMVVVTYNNVANLYVAVAEID